MLPGTYWALVESILYSSWYLDAAHMDTDKHRLGKSGGRGSRWGRGEQSREKAGEKNDAAREAFPCIASQGKAILQAQGRIWEQELCSGKIQNGIGWRILGWYFYRKYQHVKKTRLTGQNHFERHQIRVWLPVYRCTVILRHQWRHVHQWRVQTAE